MTNETQPDKPPSVNLQGRSIFRDEARQHYLANQDKVVFPRLLSHRLFWVLWLAALIFLLLGAVIAFGPLIAIGWGG